MTSRRSKPDACVPSVSRLFGLLYRVLFVCSRVNKGYTVIVGICRFGLLWVYFRLRPVCFGCFFIVASLWCLHDYCNQILSIRNSNILIIQVLTNISIWHRSNPSLPKIYMYLSVCSDFEYIYTHINVQCVLNKSASAVCTG